MTEDLQRIRRYISALVRRERLLIVAGVVLGVVWLVVLGVVLVAVCGMVADEMQWEFAQPTSFKANGFGNMY